ncbi:MAG: hypothetical protein K0S11_988, partial [Gammaproteobacteria bacterium]|nr:hypothetical protein [Gammaproteobacteria bacterium]
IFIGISAITGWPIRLPTLLNSHDVVLKTIIVGGHLLLASYCIKNFIQSLKFEGNSYKVNFQFNFYFLYFILLGISASVIIYELWQNNIDMKGWWPLAFISYSSIAALVAFLYALIISKFYGYLYTLYMSLSIILFTLMLYTAKPYIENMIWQIILDHPFYTFFAINLFFILAKSISRAFR